MKYAQAKKLLHRHANPKKAVFLKRFFKCGKGEYAEGDVMLGINNPQVRAVAKQATALTLSELRRFLISKNHEERFLSLCVLELKFEKADAKEQKRIFDFYMKNRKGINNWDLVDCSAPYIPGPYLLDRPKTLLYKFAYSSNLWEKRIAIITTQHFIRHRRFEDSLKIIEILINDEHDLIHKACGWMLREIGKRDLYVEEKFLKKHYKKMPRTMLRYAIEKFPEARRKKYLKGQV